MKTHILYLTAIFFFININLGNSQCGNELMDRGKEKLKGTTYIRDFKVLLKKSKKSRPFVVNYSVKLQKGCVYRFVAEADVANKKPLIVSLADDHRQYASNYDNKENKDKGGFEFLCQKTQIYYLSCFYKDGAAGCGVVLMSNVKTYSKY